MTYITDIRVLNQVKDKIYHDIIIDGKIDFGGSEKKISRFDL